MSSLTDPEVARLLAEPNHAVVSTVNEDGSILSTVVWVDTVDSLPAVNTAVGRRWPSNLRRDPRVTILIYEQGNPYNFVEIRGTASGTMQGADAHIERLARKYTGAAFQGAGAGEQRMTFTIQPKLIRHRRED